MISPSECTMKRSTPCVDGWCGPMLRSISSSISLVKTTSLMGAPSSLGGRLAELEKLERIGTSGGDAVVLVLFGVVLAQGITFPVVGQEQATHFVMPHEEPTEKVVTLTLVPVGHRPYVD